jgi:hypothetical protein
MRTAIPTLSVALLLTLMVATSASGEILLCISNKQLKGEETVGTCVAKGEQFAIVDEYGLVWVLTPEEIALSKALNPKVFDTRAFGLQYRNLAPELPPMPAPTREAP